MKSAVKLLLTASLTLAGCTLLEEQPAAPVSSGPARTAPPAPAAVPAPRGVAELLEYYDGLRRTDAATRTREHDRVKALFQQQQTAYARVQLALFGALPNATADQQAQALTLLEPVAQEDRPRDRELHRFAALLYATLQENRRAADAAAAAGQRAREESRRADDLQQKLDALKSIEKSLIERDQLRKNP